MRRLVAIIAFVAAMGCIYSSCNEKPKHYQFVKVMPDGNEQVTDIDATNDTDALKQYMSEMEKAIIANIDKDESEQYKAMYVISPSGDTLNTNNELLEAVMKGETSTVNLIPLTPTPDPEAKQEPSKQQGK